MINRFLFSILLIGVIFSSSISLSFAQDSTQSGTVSIEEFRVVQQELRDVRSENYQSVIEKADSAISRAEFFVNVFSSFATAVSLIFAVVGGFYIFIQRKDLGEAKSIVEFITKQSQVANENSQIVDEAKKESLKILSLLKEQKKEFEEAISDAKSKTESKIGNIEKYESEMQRRYDQAVGTANKLDNLGTIANYISNVTQYPSASASPSLTTFGNNLKKSILTPSPSASPHKSFVEWWNEELGKAKREGES